MIEKIIKLKQKEKRKMLLRLIKKKYLNKLEYYVLKLLAIDERNINMKDGAFKIKINSYIDFYRYKTFYEKEPETLKWLEKYSGDKVLYDIGANIGVYSLYFAKLSKSNKVYSFEPEAFNYFTLNSNIYINKLSNILAFNIGIGDKNEFNELYVGKFESGRSGHNIGSKSSQFHQDISYKQGIFSFTLDSLWEKYGLPFPSIIKIDVDGFEPNIIKGAEKTLQDSRLESILIEIDSQNSAIENILKSFGFRDITSTFTSNVRDNKIFIRS